MKRNTLILLLCSLALPTFQSCSNSEKWPDTDGAAPQITVEQSQFSIEAGTEVHLTGKITDADGISTINLSCPELYLDKTIDIIDIYGEPLKEYDLDYKIDISADEIGDSFDILVTVADVGGRTSETTYVIALDADYTAPVFTLMPGETTNVLIKAETVLNLRFTVTDNRAVDRIVIDLKNNSSSADLDGFPRTVDAGGARSYHYETRLQLPSEAGVYTLTLTAYDRKDLSTEAVCTINVSELQDFDKMYLSDVADAASLSSDIMGVPMLMEHTGEFTYRARYYNAESGTKVRFIPQKNDFYPISFGADPNDETVLTDDPDASDGITLGEANVYYIIDINTKEGTYTTSTYSVDEAVDPLPHTYGANEFDIWENGSEIVEFYFGLMFSKPNEGIAKFVQDENNPHVFRSPEPLVYKKGEQLNFVLHNWHWSEWWNYCSWRVDNSTEPEKWNYYGKFVNPAWTGGNYLDRSGYDNWAKPTVPADGSYTFYFDAHLGYSKFIPAK